MNWENITGQLNEINSTQDENHKWAIPNHTRLDLCINRIVDIIERAFLKI